MSVTFGTKIFFVNETILYLTGSGRSNGNSHKNLFGDSPVQQANSKNRLPSNIPIGSTDAPDSNGNLRENGYGSEKSN